jgi:hypothetical protein
MAAFTGSGVDAIPLFLVTMVVIFSVVGYLLGQLSYKGAGLAAPLATVSVVNPVAASIAGVAVFDESFRFGHAGLAVVAIAAVVITWGVIGLSRRATVAGPPGDDQDEAAAAYAHAEQVDATAEHKPDPEAEPTPH